MNPTRFALAAALVATASLPAAASAAGYAVYEQGAAVLGMAGAGTASVHDASALFFNPAKLVTLPGTQLYAGGSALTVSSSFAGIGPYPGFGVTEEMNTRSYYPPVGYVTHNFGGVAIGAGVNAPFGLGVDWKNPTTFTGRYVTTRAQVRALNANVTLARALGGRAGVAAGFDALFASVDLRQYAQSVIPGGGGAIADVAIADLTADFAPGYGWNAALWWQASERTQLGLAYRGRIQVDLDGTVDFTLLPTGNALLDAGAAAKLKDQDVSSMLRFPAILSAGVAYSPVPEWTFEGDFNWTQWSYFEELPITFKTTPELSTTVREDYRDSWQVRTGAEYRRPRVTYRFGYYFDRAAAPVESVTPLLPDADRNGVAFGLGWPAAPGLTLDVYDCALFVRRRTTDGVEHDNFNGVYRGFVNLSGAALSWRF